MPRRAGTRVDRDHFEIGIVCQLHYVIVSAHGAMKSAFRHLDAESPAQVVDTLLQRSGGDDDVIELIHVSMLNHSATC